MNFPAKITVLSSSAGPLPGATVSLRLSTAQTDSTGVATVWFTDSDLGKPGLLTVSAPGFVKANVSILFPSTGGTYTTTVTLQAAAGSTGAGILVRDAVTQQPISGAQVFVDGGAAYVTDSSGRVTVTYPSVPATVSVSASGYIQTTQSTSGSSVFDLANSQAPPVQVTITVEPSAATPGAAVTLSTAGFTDSLQVGSDGTVVSVHSLIPGVAANITVTQAGFNTLTTTLTPVAGQTNYTIGPLLKASADLDAGNAANPVPGAPVADSGVDNVVPLNLVKTPDSYEYIYPSSEYGKYFTTTQARMYIGNIFVDELHTVQFVLQANRVPIYGYASRDFDDVAFGRALVQGQIFINFISEGYLYTIVKEYAKLARSARQADNPNAPAQEQFDNLRRTHEFLQKANLQLPGNTLSQQGSNPDGTPVNLATQKDVRLQLVEQRMGQLAALGPAVVDSGRFFQPGTTVYANAAYHPIAFDIEIELEGAGRVAKRRLEKCYLGSNEMVMDQSGEVLGETYSFIARRLR